jgi:hypothetical protein
MEAERKELIAFHGNHKVKELYLTKVKEIVAANKCFPVKDDYIMPEQGRYNAIQASVELEAVGDMYKYRSNYETMFRIETELGIPLWLAHLEDAIFNILNTYDAIKWPTKFLEAIPVGADLELVRPRFLHWLLVDERSGILQLIDGKYDYKDEYTTKVRKAISQVAGVLKRWFETGRIDEAARSVAEAAAYSAAKSALSVKEVEDSAPPPKAWSRRWSAWLAEYAADSAAKSAAYKSMAWSAGLAVRQASHAWSTVSAVAKAAAAEEAQIATVRGVWSAASASEAMISSTAERLLQMLSEAPVKRVWKDH